MCLGVNEQTEVYSTCVKVWPKRDTCFALTIYIQLHIADIYLSITDLPLNIFCHLYTVVVELGLSKHFVKITLTNAEGIIATVITL